MVIEGFHTSIEGFGVDWVCRGRFKIFGWLTGVARSILGFDGEEDEMTSGRVRSVFG